MALSEVDKEAAMVDHSSVVHKADSASSDADHGFTPQEQRKIIHRIDRRLVVLVGALYCVSLMDRTNMSAAAIAGMRVELGMINNNEYQVANLVFFVTYIVFQPPSTVLIRKIGPRIHLSLITLFWGAVMIGMGFAKKFTDIMVMRLLLGLLESGFFPGCVYLLSTWYTRYEVGKRYGIFYLIGSCAAAFAGILAYGLMQMNGLANLTGWRWIFIIEGIITCLLAILGFWLLVDFPDSVRGTWSFLNDRERRWIIDRVNRDRGDAVVPPFNLKSFLLGGLDWKIWVYGLLFCCTTTVTYALAYFLPIILVQNMGFDVGAAQCLVAPPYAFAAIVTFGIGWLGDRFRIRGPLIICNMVLCLIGLPIMGFHSMAGVRYMGVFFVTAGANANVPAVMSYQANNIRGQWKRAFCSATLVGFGGVGGIAGSLVFRDMDAPGYRPGLYACIVACGLNIILVLILMADIHRNNKAADSGKKVLEANDGEAQENFRYTY